MTERGMIFNAPMVRALLDGSKTQTRRIMKVQPSSGVRTSPFVKSGFEDGHGKEISCPFGVVGDRIWVRETWAMLGNEDRCPIDWNDNIVKEGGHDAARIYRASCTQGDYGLWQIPDDADWKPHTDNMQYDGAWTPSIHMPRWASRITLEITDVRVERLNSISEADAAAEGCAGGHDSIPDYHYSATPHEHFRHVWTSIYGEDGWSSAWVWVIEFKRVEAV